ncbi:MAG: ABC transporter ATP-binding protein [Gemmatimonas sp.]
MRNGTTSERDAATTAAMLDLKDVRLTLESGAGEVNILRGVSVVVPRGQTVAVLGPSGSGKSSLLMVAAGIERASGGRVTIAGTDITRLDEDGRAAFRQRHIGVVFQAFHLVPAMTALENVMVPMEIAGARDAAPRAKAALAAVGLEHRLTHYPTQLSGGEQQRVAIARAFATEPELVLADEPTGNLDAETGHHVADLLFAMSRERGTTLLLVTHDPDLATRCGRILNMHDGRLEEGSAQ